MKSRQLIAKLLRPFLSLFQISGGLSVITFHNIQPNQYSWFEEVIEMLAQNFEFATIDSLDSNVSGYEGLKILITFDDGFYSSRLMAENYLSRFGIKAIFFITEEFIGLDDAESFQFVKKNFYPNSNIKSDCISSFKAMNWEDIQWLVNQGHSIGAHTGSHLKLSEAEDENQLNNEILVSTNHLERKIGSKVNCFAYPFGTLDSISLHAIKIAQNRFDFIFSNVRGSVSDSPGNHFIFRQNMVPGDPIWLVKAMVEGRLDWRYRKMKDDSHKKFSKI